MACTDSIGKFEKWALGETARILVANAHPLPRNRLAFQGTVHDHVVHTHMPPDLGMRWGMTTCIWKTSLPF